MIKEIKYFTENKLEWKYLWLLFQVEPNRLCQLGCLHLCLIHSHHHLAKGTLNMVQKNVKKSKTQYNNRT